MRKGLCMTEQKTLMEETLEVETWSPPYEEMYSSQPLATEVIGNPDAALIEEDTQSNTIEASVTPGLEAMATASSPPALTKRFKAHETFMAQSGVMMERDAYYVIPSTAVTYPTPEEYSLGVVYENEKPQGRLFSGQNRKARRAAEKQKMRAGKAK